jgi:adenine/guanine/hypoxanthine permease
MLERLFKLRQLGTSVSTEILAGATTFMTMSYIIFVQPAVLSQSGMDFGAVMTATCIATAFATLLMGLWANYPIAQAPGMGENFFFVYTVALGLGVGWEKALGMVFLSGVLFTALSFFRVRELVLDAMPEALRHAIAAGIGAFILLIGLGHAGVLVRHQEAWQEFFSASRAWEAVHSGNWGFFLNLFRVYGFLPGWGMVQFVALAGLALSAALVFLRVNGALLVGMSAAAVLALLTGLIHWQGLISSPPSLAPTLWKFDPGGLFSWRLFPLVLVFLFMNLFDTVGTLVGVSSQAGLLDEQGKLPRARRALLSDALGTTLGAALGTSTVTSYIESAAGVQAGGRTGLTAVVCALFFSASIFFSPLVRMVGNGVEAGQGVTLYPVTAAALIVVGVLMLRSVGRIPHAGWQSTTAALLLIVGIPLSYSIADGLAFGFISYPLLHLLSGRARQLNWLIYLLGLIFLLRYLFL